jgi:hypothetical protein
MRILDANSNDSGDVTNKFVAYTRKANRDLLERSFNGTEFLKDISVSLRDFFAEYPENFPCQERTSASPR